MLTKAEQNDDGDLRGWTDGILTALVLIVAYVFVGIPNTIRAGVCEWWETRARR